jgi:20S proteasome alpha/beta subunit
MTSIIGLKVEDEEGKGIIFIGADRQATEYKEDIPVRKGTAEKIWWNDNWALAYTGTVTEHLETLKRLMFGYKTRTEKEWDQKKAAQMFERALTGKEPFFQEISEHSRKMRRTGSSRDDLNDFLLATRNPLALWHIDESGNIYNYETLCKRNEKEPSPFEYIVIGSGEDEMIKYIETRIDDESSLLHPKNLKIRTAPVAIINILHQAEHDIYTTGPPTILGVTKNGVYHFGARIRKRLEEAELEEAEDIGAELEELLD